MIPVSLCSDAVPYNETYIMTPSLVNITMNLIDGTINYLNSTTLGAVFVTIKVKLYSGKFTLSLSPITI